MHRQDVAQKHQQTCRDWLDGLDKIDAQEGNNGCFRDRQTHAAAKIGVWRAEGTLGTRSVRQGVSARNIRQGRLGPGCVALQRALGCSCPFCLGCRQSQSLPLALATPKERPSSTPPLLFRPGCTSSKLVAFPQLTLFRRSTSLLSLTSVLSLLCRPSSL